MTADRYAKNQVMSLYLKNKLPITFTEIELKDFIEKIFKDGMQQGKASIEEEYESTDEYNR